MLFRSVAINRTSGLPLLCLRQEAGECHWAERCLWPHPGSPCRGNAWLVRPGPNDKLPPPELCSDNFYMTCASLYSQVRLTPTGKHGEKCVR